MLEATDRSFRLTKELPSLRKYDAGMMIVVIFFTESANYERSGEGSKEKYLKISKAVY